MSSKQVLTESRNTVPAATVRLANSKNTVPPAKSANGTTGGNFSRNTVPAASKTVTKK